MARIVLAGREVWPFIEGGGIGRYVATAAATLAPFHEVTILTTARHAPMRDDPRLPEGVALEFAEEPAGEIAPFATSGQAWSVALLDALRALQPDVVEFQDYLGEGFATVHARRAGDPALRGTSVVVRVQTSGEMVEALNEVPPSPAHGLIWGMERFAIRNADALLVPEGDVLERYRAFYGRVAEPVELSSPVRIEELLPPADIEPPADGPLRLLYLNRLERRKGILELVKALVESTAEIQLTIVGGDTMSGPGGTSMREALEEFASVDERVDLRQGVPHAEVPALIAAHHAVAVPVRWETFSYVTREALAVGRPVLATPSGAIPEVVIPGRSGWLTRDLSAALDSLDVATASELAEGARPALEASLTDPEVFAATYGSLGRAWRPPRRVPDVAAIVALCAGDSDIELTLGSLAAQHDVRVGTTLVAEPLAMPRVAALLRAERVVLAEGGRPAMWRAGADATSATHLLLVPAGAELDRDFTRRALEALGDDEFDYATAFVARGRRPWHAPLGGEASAASGIDAGASVAVVRREALAHEASTERELWAGLSGVVLHEPLVLRVPRRTADRGEPAEGGAPSAEAVAATFADVLSLGAAA